MRGSGNGEDPAAERAGAVLRIGHGALGAAEAVEHRRGDRHQLRCAGGAAGARIHERWLGRDCIGLAGDLAVDEGTDRLVVVDRRLQTKGRDALVAVEAKRTREGRRGDASSGSTGACAPAPDAGSTRSAEDRRERAGRRSPSPERSRDSPAAQSAPWSASLARSGRNGASICPRKPCGYCCS